MCFQRSISKEINLKYRMKESPVSNTKSLILTETIRQQLFQICFSKSLFKMMI